MEVYRDLVHNVKVHELASHLVGMPEISINLSSLQYQGFSDAPFLDLAPATFLDSVDDHIPTPVPEKKTGNTP